MVQEYGHANLSDARTSAHDTASPPDAAFDAPAWPDGALSPPGSPTRTVARAPLAGQNQPRSWDGMGAGGEASHDVDRVGSFDDSEEAESAAVMLDPRVLEALYHKATLEAAEAAELYEAARAEANDLRAAAEQARAAAARAASERAHAHSQIATLEARLEQTTHDLRAVDIQLVEARQRVEALEADEERQRTAAAAASRQIAVHADAALALERELSQRRAREAELLDLADDLRAQLEERRRLDERLPSERHSSPELEPARASPGHSPNPRAKPVPRLSPGRAEVEEGGERASRDGIAPSHHPVDDGDDGGHSDGGGDGERGEHGERRVPPELTWTLDAARSTLTRCRVLLLSRVVRRQLDMAARASLRRWHDVLVFTTLAQRERAAQQARAHALARTHSHAVGLVSAAERAELRQRLCAALTYGAAASRAEHHAAWSGFAN